jgi:hypothetical protein
LDNSQDEFDIDHQITFHLEDMAVMLEVEAPLPTVAPPSRPPSKSGTGSAPSGSRPPSRLADASQEVKAEGAHDGAIVVKLESLDALDAADAEVLERAKRRRLLPGAATSDQDLRTR